MTESSVSALVSSLEQKMLRHKNDAKAKNMAAYLKNKFACYGIKSPVRNEIQKKWFREVAKADVNHWDLIYSLWNMEQREYQYVALDYMRKIPARRIEREDYKFLEELITTKSWWDSVDAIASNYTGKYFQKFPEMKEKVILRWRSSDNMWLNRTCLIFQLKYKHDVDFDLLKSLIIQFQANKEFFIQKAIGWSLRQYSKFNPDAVRDFVEEIQLEGLAKREAMKYI